MATWVNLMDIVYPVGSVYLSVSSTSPSSTIGGTWTQIKGAVLAAYGANSFASSGNYGGSLKISVSQMPEHSHDYIDGGAFCWEPNASSTAVCWGAKASVTAVQTGKTGGGGKLPALSLFHVCLAQNSLVGGYNAYTK